jgi:hypothetical protein
MSTVGVPVGEPDVYFISGHGAEYINTFIVPDGCYVVVKKNTCELTPVAEFHSEFENITQMDMELLLKPDTDNATIELQKKFDASFEVYGPKMVCPNFVYHLCNVHVHGDSILVDIYIGSGCINISRVKKYPILPMDNKFYTIYRNDTYLGTKEELIGNIVSLYRYSAYPSMVQIKSYLTSTWKYMKTVTPFEILEDLSKQSTPGFISVTQEQLCKRYKGVFYHSVCRDVSSALKMYKSNLNNFKNGNRTDKCTNMKTMIKNPIFHRLIEGSLMRKCFHKRYQKSNNATEKRYQSALKNCNDLEKRLEKITKMENDIINKGYSTNEEEKQLKNIGKTMRPDALARALDNARNLCKKYKSILNNTERSRSPTRRTEHNNNNTRRNTRNRTRYNNNNNNTRGRTRRNNND